MARDRNHDRIPDRWERAHHLSLRVNQARRDQDRDGLNNRGEFRAHMNPRDRDTDNDGIKDGDEHAGTISSFESGVLRIALAGGGTLTGRVTDATEIECGETETASASDHGRGGDDQGEDRGDDQGEDRGDDQGEDRGDDQGEDRGDDQGEDRDDADDDDAAEDCGTAALVAGATVREAKLSGSGGSAVFRKIELGS